MAKRGSHKPAAAATKVGNPDSMEATNVSDRSNPAGGWAEADSSTFVDHGPIFVPDRTEQIEIMSSLVPNSRGEGPNVLELGSGDGSLAASVMDRFPDCSYWALDGSEVMRRSTVERLADHSARLHVLDFQLESDEWRRNLPEPLDCVLASLVVHHLDEAGKIKLFADLATRISDGGALVIADIVTPMSPVVQRAFSRQWDQIVLRQSVAAKDPSAFQVFQQDRWNYYSDPDPDPYDKPSRLVDQLRWLMDAGFRDVDCVWLAAGHAIFAAVK